MRTLTLTLAAPLLACHGDSPSEPPGGRLTLAAKVAPSSVSAGEPLEVTLTAENRGSERVELQLGGCRSSFLITRGGAVVFDLKDTLACPAVVTSLVLEPGESASFRHVWHPPTRNRRDSTKLAASSWRTRPRW